jgi:NADH:ubiquinone oxidoreductase subunit 6 (subunit J)
VIISPARFNKHIIIPAAVVGMTGAAVLSVIQVCMCAGAVINLRSDASMTVQAKGGLDRLEGLMTAITILLKFGMILITCNQITTEYSQRSSLVAQSAWTESITFAQPDRYTQSGD